MSAQHDRIGGNVSKISENEYLVLKRLILNTKLSIRDRIKLTKTAYRMWKH